MAVGLTHDGTDKRLGKIVTNMGQGLRCELRVPKNEFTPLMIERLGSSPSIQPRPAYDVVTFWIQSLKENDAAQFAELVAAATRSLLERAGDPT